ncbi:hypothetical protein P7K49_005307 [Saguinus oedipus]|uniref:Uncharacterized protein n=1 Tax=Saguinus oedipus TaxID=9490 RepID=A0ABQ9WAA8_SAGOE|nr:hypothetical protein P7K49_005307 [Saguinus oedipus]
MEGIRPYGPPGIPKRRPQPMGASPRAGRGRQGGERRDRGAQEGRARALSPQSEPRPPRLSAPAPEPGPRAAAAAGGTMSCAGRAGPARLAALALLTCSLWSVRADNASQEYYTALINVTVQEPGRSAPLTFRIDRGRYGLDSPKAEVRGQVLAPLPLHGGECRAGAGGLSAAGGSPRPWLACCSLPCRPSVVDSPACSRGNQAPGA